MSKHAEGGERRPQEQRRGQQVARRDAGGAPPAQRDAQAQALEKSKKQLEKVLSHPKFLRKLADSLPQHLTPARVLRVASTAISKSPDLLKCSPFSFATAIIEAAELGLVLDGHLGHAYLTPWWNKHTQRHEAQMLPGYKGKILLGEQGGRVRNVSAHVVRQGDQFTYAEGAVPRLEHTPALDNDGPIVAAYCRWEDEQGRPHWRVIGAKKIGEHRAKSKATGESAPWNEWPAEMAEKTAVHVAARFWPMDPESSIGRAQERMRVRETALEAGGAHAEIPAEGLMNLDLLDVLGDTDAGDAARARQEDLARETPPDPDPPAGRPAAGDLVVVAGDKVCPGCLQRPGEPHKTTCAELASAVDEAGERPTGTGPHPTPADQQSTSDAPRGGSGQGGLPLD